MALFGFGKKKEKRVEEKQEKIVINRCKWPRYYPPAPLQCSLGPVLDFSKNSIAVGMDDPEYEIGDEVLIEFLNQKYQGIVTRIAPDRVAFVLDRDLPPSVLEQALPKWEDEPFEEEPLDKEILKSDADLERSRAIVNLMLEINDPNTRIDKIKENLSVLPELRNRLIARANASDVAGAQKISDAGNAIARLGFDEAKKIIYNYITYEVQLKNDILKNFENYDLYNLLMTALFKELSPLFNFKDVKNEGRSLLLMSIVGAMILAKKAPRLVQFYKGPKELYSAPMRGFERKEAKSDFLVANRTYFLDILRLFVYTFDGLVLGHMNLYPCYIPSFSIELSQRRLRYGYVVYLVLLGVKYILGKDLESGYLFLQKLEKAGLKGTKQSEFLHNLLAGINHTLAEIGRENKVVLPPLKPLLFKPSDYIGKGYQADYFMGRWNLWVDKGERLALRYEDSTYTHYVLERLLAYSNLAKETFCVVPCAQLKDDEFGKEIFDGFEVIIFKEVDRLPKHLFASFKKVWEEFEGRVIATFSVYSELEYNDLDKYNLLQPYIINFPFYEKDETLVRAMKNQVCKAVNDIFGDVCKEEDLQSKDGGMRKLCKEVIAKI